MAGKKRRKQKAVPKGDEFMKGVPTEDIRTAYRKEKTVKAVAILLACLARRNGGGGAAIAAMLHMPRSTIYDWLSRMHHGGLAARCDRPKSGRPRKIKANMYRAISRSIDAQPEGCGIKSNVWTGRLILLMLAKTFGVDGISPNTIYRTMHRLDKSYRKPGRPFDHRTPSDDIKSEFKGNLAQEIIKYAAAGYRLFWIDESHFSTKTIRGMTWLARGLSVPQIIKPFGRRYTCFGALGPDGLLHHRYYDRANTDYMIEFVRSLHDAYGRVLLVMDNASYHRSKRLMEEIKKMGDDVKIVYQPAYSPDLNPVEMVWKELKKYVANGRYKEVDDMTGSMDEMIRSGTVRLPSLPEYALDALGRAGAVAA